MLARPSPTLSAVYTAERARLVADNKTRITIGDYSEIYEGALALTYGGSIRIGQNVGINTYCVL